MNREHPLQILLIEDSKPDAELCLRTLKKEGIEAAVDRVETLEAFTERVRSKTYDLILSDYHLHEWVGTEALQVLKQQGKNIPFIMVTGTAGEEFAVDCIKQGAWDYILKDNLKRLTAAIPRALEEKALRDDRMRMDRELRTREKHFHALIENIADAITLIDADGSVLYASPASHRIVGYPADELVGRRIFDLVHPDDLETTKDFWGSLLREPSNVVAAEFRVRHRDSSWRWIEGAWTNLLANESVQAIVANYRDISNRKRAQEELRKYAEALRKYAEGLCVAAGKVQSLDIEGHDGRQPPLHD